MQPSEQLGTYLQVKLGTGAHCYPLTVIDDYSRYLLACRRLESVATAGTRSAFEGIHRTQHPQGVSFGEG